ncbi:MAG: hypothetical protein ACRENP_26725 [Longimicrobiales bacterium]
MTAQFPAAEFGLPEHAQCPFCRGHNTELHSPFGSQLAVSTYWCKRCFTAFEVFKPSEEHDPTDHDDSKTNP